MRLLILVFSILYFCFNGVTLHSQTTLFEEKFDNCILPANWQTKVTGNQLVQWYVGTSQNSAAQGQSIDGSCFLFIDDDNAGQNTPGYILEFTSPAFNTSLHERVELSLDVHFRYRSPTTQQALDILVTDGSSEQLLYRFDQYQNTGDQISDFVTLRYDLSLVKRASNVRLILRYKDNAGEWGWWAGIDNIKVVGSGTGTVLVGEGFNGCAKPAGWETAVLAGQNDWQFGHVPTTSAAHGHGSSIDGTCFVYFDDDALGGQAPPSTIKLTSPWFNGTDYFNYTLDYDIILRYTGETIKVYLENESGIKTTLFQSTGQVGGPWLPQSVHHSYDLNPYRSTQLRVVFEYTDNGVFGYWVGLDNFKVVGEGSAIDFCNQAQKIYTGEPCVEADNSTALFNGPAPDCSGRAVSSLWFRWVADFDGIAQLNTNANFNDIVNIYTNVCTNLAPVLCNNRDEHGFTGETTYFQAEFDQTYFIRVAGQADGFGLEHGSVCVDINQTDAYPVKPVNDDCNNAIPLTVNGACLNGTNRNADMSATLPSLNALARADVWYKFTAGALLPGDVLSVKSNASFSDIITVYSGSCNSLTEVAGNNKGGNLQLPALTQGATYYVQIAGSFASIEGTLCPALSVKQSNVLPNNNCVNATPVSLGALCTAGNNTGATFSGYQPTCAVNVDRDIWFSFIAPSFGSVQINTGATFEHIVAVWTGDCTDLKPVFCSQNPLRCDGYVTAGSLNAGQKYYVQIASWNDAGGVNTGNVCLKILDGQVPPDFSPLTLNVLQPCVGIDSARLYVEVTGGVLPYTYAADMNGQIIPSGESYAVIVMDGMGCEVQQLGTAVACASNVCTTNTTIQTNSPTCKGGSNGSLLASVSGAVTTLQYKWSNGSESALNSNLKAGTYTLTVTESNGCVEVVTATLTDPPGMTLNATGSSISCAGNTNGSVMLSVSGGAPGYSFQWSGGQTSSSLNNLPAGTYTVTVSDQNNCTATISATVTSPPLLQVATTHTGISCFGASDGTINLTVSGGTAGYSFMWSGSQTSPNLSNLPPGTYTVTVTDQKNCTAVANATILEPGLLQVSTVPTNAACHGVSNGGISTVVSGGTAGFEFLWSGGQTGPNLNNLPAGTYTVTVTDNNNCTTTTSATITEPAAIQLTATPTNVTCFGAADGMISTTVSGGAAGFTYSWSNGADTPNLDSLTPGTFSLIVTDASGCTASLATFITGPPALDFSANRVNVSCYLGADGAIQLNLAGGVPGFTYLWSTGSTEKDLTGLQAGSYTVTITESNGCTNLANVVLSEPDTLFIVQQSIQQPLQGQQNGAVDVSIAGGTPPFTYTWTLNNTSVISTQEDLVGAPGGQYSLVVTDSNSCTASFAVVLTEIVGTINPAASDLQVLVYPNPANDNLTVTIDMANPRPLRFRFIDLLGRLSLERQTATQSTRQVQTFNLKDMPAGMYLLQVLAADGQYTQPVVIAR
ncbi:MAG: T9SS type A sorting domain-containing protein [Lewinellaceae bacterium]|nr:T9SS type A sorting domain-containing protein [Saprospiraceae bacterium]MCB9330159.1 T9SS type A sorting domain-containing protein [Lewinellaceae bacterium]